MSVGFRGRTARGRARRRTGAGIMVLAAVAVVAVGVIAASIALGPEPLGEDLCPRSGPKALVAILIDSTDQLSGAQVLDIRNRLIKRISALPTGAAIQLWKVTPGGAGVPEPVGRLVCRPERDPNRLFQNVRASNERYASFEREALAQIDAGLNAGSQPQSAILEALQAVSLRTFGAPRFTGIRHKEVLIVSDLRQNTQGLSLLSAIPTFAQFQSMPSYLRLRADLKDVTVKVLFISRGTTGVRPLLEFWQAAIADYGGVLDEVERVVG